MEEKNQPSYVWEMLTHSVNVSTATAFLAGSALASMPWGIVGAAIPLIVFVTGEMVASLFVPSHPKFKEYVDNKNRRQEREKARSHLVAEIQKRASKKEYGSVGVYNRIMERVEALYKVAGDSNSKITVRDAERIEDASIDYLSLWLAAIVMDERGRSTNIAEITNKLKQVEEALGGNLTNGERLQLEKAKKEYSSILFRHKNLYTKRISLEATMTSLPDQIEEIYQMVLASPYSSSMESKLSDSLAKLNLEEELENELANDLYDITPELDSRKKKNVVLQRVG